MSKYNRGSGQRPAETESSEEQNSGRREAGRLSPLFEPLEQRLLLTTLNGGDFFIYHNAAGQGVRIDLVGDPEDSIEMFGYDNISTNIVDGSPFPGLIDLVGLINGTGEIRWPDDLSILGGTPAAPTWAEIVTPPPVYDPLNPPAASPRGSRNEISRFS